VDPTGRTQPPAPCDRYIRLSASQSLRVARRNGIWTCTVRCTSSDWTCRRCRTGTRMAGWADRIGHCLGKRSSA